MRRNLLDAVDIIAPCGARTLPNQAEDPRMDKSLFGLKSPISSVENGTGDLTREASCLMIYGSWQSTGQF